MRFVSKRIVETINSNGDQRTVFNIVNRRNNEVYRTQAVSNKKDPKKYHVIQQSVERKGTKTIEDIKMYQMKEKDIIELFKSAEKKGTDNLKKMGAVEVKKDTKELKDKKKILKKTSTTSKRKVVLKKKSKKSMKGGNYEATGQDGVVRGFDPTNNFRDMAPFQTLEQERGQKGGKGMNLARDPINYNMDDAMNKTLTSVTKISEVLKGGKKKINKK